MTDEIIESVLTENTEQPSELDLLKGELSRYRERETREAELAALRELFPELDISAIPDEVIEASRAPQTLPLTAAYAIYARRKEMRVRSASEAKKPLPTPGQSPESDTFTREEISRMSRADVRRNYSKIMRSLSAN